MDLSGQLHDPAAISTGKINLEPTGNVTVWAHGQVRILCIMRNMSCPYKKANTSWVLRPVVAQSQYRLSYTDTPTSKNENVFARKVWHKLQYRLNYPGTSYLKERKFICMQTLAQVPQFDNQCNRLNDVSGVEIISSLAERADVCQSTWVSVDFYCQRVTGGYVCQYATNHSLSANTVIQPNIQ